MTGTTIPRKVIFITLMLHSFPKIKLPALYLESWAVITLSFKNLLVIVDKSLFYHRLTLRPQIGNSLPEFREDGFALIEFVRARSGRNGYRG